MMDVIKKPNNMEVFKKLLNSVAKKYDCGVTFSVESGRLSFDGDKECADQILKEASEILDNGSRSDDAETS